MHSAANPLFAAPATDGDRPGACEAAAARDVHAELDVLKEIVRLLPAGITVQDEAGRFLLVNDAAAAQLKIPAGEKGAAPPLSVEALARRRDICIELLRSELAAVREESVGDGPLERTWLIARR